MASSPYAAVSTVPLIQSPSLRVPSKVILPPDIHPLPESVTPYFVYPFTLEPHILTIEANRRNTLASHLQNRESLLRSRKEEKERRKRDALRKIAPGFESTGSVLVPTKRESQAGAGQETKKDVMDELVDQLAALDTSSAA